MDAISVVVPTYNGSRFVGAALASVLRQTRPAAEIIVVDDCSGDDTLAVVRQFAAQSPIPVRAIRLPRNSGGPAHPMNVGIEAAQGQLIAILDQDDLLDPRRLAEQAGALEADSAVELAFGLCALARDAAESLNTERYGTIDLGNPPPDLELCTREPIRLELLRIVCPISGSANWSIPGPALLRLLLRYGNFVAGYPGFMFRRSSWQRKGGLDTRYRIASDYDLLCWLTGSGTTTLIPRALYVRRLHDNNLANQQEATQRDLAAIKSRTFQTRPELRNDQALVTEVRRNLLGQAYWYRRAGYWREAWETYDLIRQAFGWTRELAADWTKVPGQWLVDLITRRSPCRPPWLPAESGANAPPAGQRQPFM